MLFYVEKEKKEEEGTCKEDELYLIDMMLKSNKNSLFQKRRDRKLKINSPIHQ
jgi:hypothetical protein